MDRGLVVFKTRGQQIVAGLIPRTFIDDVLAKTDIVEVISRYVKLKKSGREYQSCCPFHSEKTPSFTVSPKKQFYYCFGCHAKGNVISFLMDYKNLSFTESVEELAGYLGLNVPYEKNSNSQRISGNFSDEHSEINRNSLYSIMEDIANYYSEQLKSDSSAQEYIQQRRLSPEVTQRFQIGFAPEGFNNLQQRFGKLPNFGKIFSQLGMLSQNDRGNSYDRFRKRIMFPIRDRRGRVIAFGGRVTDDSKPKYLNSPESATYHKGNELYGLFEASQSMPKIEKLLVVEGYMDVVALAQFGVNYAVASLGTATTPEQLRLAFRYTDQIICCYDADRAGREAAWRALENVLTLLEDGRQIKFIFLPDGEDPDTFIRKNGKDEFENALTHAQTFSQFFFAHLAPQVDFSTPEGKLKLLTLAMPMIKQVAGEGLKQHLINQLKNLTGIWEDKLFKDTLPEQEVRETKASRAKITPMRILISLLIQKPELANLTTSSGKKITLPPLQSFNEAGFDLLNQIFTFCQNNLGITTGQLLEQWRGTSDFNILEKLATWNNLVSDGQEEKVFVENLLSLHQKFVNNRVNSLIAKERSTGLTTSERQELLVLLQQDLQPT